MNLETFINNPNAQTKPANKKDDNVLQDSDKKIEIVTEVTNILDNLVKKVEKSSDDEENVSDDNENIFKTESKVNGIEKSDDENHMKMIDKNEEQNEDNIEELNSDNVGKQNKNTTKEQDKDNTEEQDKDNTEEQDKDNTEKQDKDNTEKQDKDNTEEQDKDNTEKKDKDNTEEQEKDNAEEQNKDNTKEQSKDNIEGENKDNTEEQDKGNIQKQNEGIEDQNKENIEEQNEEKIEDKSEGEIESVFHSTLNGITDLQKDASSQPGILEKMIRNEVSSLTDGRIDISTETDHREKKMNRKNKNQDGSKQAEQTEQKDGNDNIQYSDQVLQNALDAMLKKRLLPDIKMRPSVINYARRVCDEKMMNEEYDQALNIDIAIDIMYTSMDGINKDVNKQQMNENVYQRLQMTKERKEEVEKKWNDRITEQKNNNSQKLAELTKSHEKEKSVFINEWNNPQALVAFSKPSAKLFQLRKQQKTLALVHDFEGAKLLKIEADQLEKLETSEGLRKAESSMKNQYMALLDRQNREVTCLVDNSKMAIEKLEMLKLKELCSIENTEKVLQSRLMSSPSNSNMVNTKKTKMVLNPTVVIPNVNSNSGARPRSLSSSMKTNRVRSQPTSYKALGETWRLKLKLSDINKTILSVEPSAKNKQNSTL